MNRMTKAMGFALLLMLGSTAVAHDEKQHKGMPVEGEVTAVAADRVTLKTEAAATVIVMLDDKTKLERGDRPASKADVKQGDHLAVFGTRLATGELVAREVIIEGMHHEGMGDRGGHDTPGAH